MTQVLDLIEAPSPEELGRILGKRQVFDTPDPWRPTQTVKIAARDDERIVCRTEFQPCIGNLGLDDDGEAATVMGLCEGLEVEVTFFKTPHQGTIGELVVHDTPQPV